jgi:adenine-specific DNA-methyltransferase
MDLAQTGKARPQHLHAVTSSAIGRSNISAETPASCRVYTPPRLAMALVRALGDEPTAEWLEPCVGKGSFLTALAERRVDSHRILAIDVDESTETADAFADTLRGTEFLSWAQTTNRRFQRIVANPPYLSLSLAPGAVRDSATRHEAPDGTPVTAGANLWYAFLCASLKVLAPGGTIGIVLPAAWDYADYALPLRRSLAGLFQTVFVHRSERPLFADVLDGSVVIVAAGYQYQPRRSERYLHSNAEDLIGALEASCPADARKPALSLIESNPRAAAVVPRLTPHVELREVVSIRLGGVTGQVGYFLMTDTARRRHKLPIEAMERVVTHAGHLSSSVLSNRDWSRLKNSGERVWLFRPRGKVRQHAAVRRYLMLRIEQGGCNQQAHKISLRKPWHRTPLPDRIHGFMSGMTSAGPWICLREANGVNATNTLYVVSFNRSVPAAMRPAWALAMLATSARESFRARARRYAHGLMKFEPGDLLGAMVPIPSTSAGASETYERAVEALLGGREKEACQIADGWLASAPPLAVASGRA